MKWIYGKSAARRPLTGEGERRNSKDNKIFQDVINVCLNVEDNISMCFLELLSMWVLYTSE